MAAVLVGVDDSQVARELLQALEAAGHQARSVLALETTPAPGRPTPDVLLVDGDAPGMDLAVVAAAWRRREPPPALLVFGATQSARAQADRVHARLIPKPVDPEQIASEVERMLHGARVDASLTPDEALRVLGLVGGGLPDDQAAMILAGSRKIDVTLVREALRPHIYDYVTATFLLERLLQRRCLQQEEARLAVGLDGSRTVRGAIDGLPRTADDRTPIGALSSHQSARLMWALAAGGAAILSTEPPPHHPTARLRAHLRARKPGPTAQNHYQVLEVGLEATQVEIERAGVLAEMRFGPAATGLHDLGDLTGVAAQVWERISLARAILGTPRQRADYDGMLARHSELEEMRQRRLVDGEEAERMFHRGQQALAGGDVFRAVSELAAAARRMPGHPDYEAYAAWARFIAEDTRDLSDADRQRAAEHGRRHAESVLRGRRPWPRALCALGLLCEAAGDTASAVAHLRDALTADDTLAPARVALARLRG